MRALFLILPAACVVGFPIPLAAEERRIRGTAFVGALEVVALHQGHGGFYFSAGGGVVIPVGETASFIPALGFEAAPENGRWGIVGSLTFDQAFSERFGMNVNVLIGEDHVKFEFARAQPFFGFGLGPSFYLGRFVLAPGAYWVPGPGGGAVVPNVFASCLF